VRGFAGLEVLTAFVMKSYIFGDITPCSLLKVKRRFGLSSVFTLVKLEYLELTVRRREVGEVLVVAGRAPAC
jgi:hypothetical protein